MIEIDSIKHPAFLQLRDLRTIKGQKNLNRYLVEEELITEAIEAGASVKQIFTTDPSHPLFPSIEIYRINPGLMRKIYPQGRPPKSVAICEAHLNSLLSFEGKKSLVILEGIQDSGNLGTILRTCEAFGIEGVVIASNDLTHLYNRVTVRSSMGAIFRLSFCFANIGELSIFFKDHLYEVIATSPHAPEAIESICIQKPFAVMFGNETDGLTREMAKLANRQIAIRMVGKMESLNVAVACGIILHALKR